MGRGQLEFLYGVSTTGSITVVDGNENVDQNNYSASVAFPLAVAPSSGVIESAAFSSVATTSLAPDLNVYIFSADPEMLLNGSGLTTAASAAFVGSFPVASADWDGDTAIKLAFKSLSIPYSAAPGLWVVLQLTSATSLNANSNEGEVYKLELRYRIRG